jgi:hypothetical protein
MYYECTGHITKAVVSERRETETNQQTKSFPMEKVLLRSNENLHWSLTARFRGLRITLNLTLC